MQVKIGAALIAASILLGSISSSASGLDAQQNIPVYNNAGADFSSKEIEKAYLRTFERFRKALPTEMLAKIDPKLIEGIYIVEKTSNPDVSEAGLTKATLDGETGEVETITIEVRHGFRKGFRGMSFQDLLEHEFAHAFAFMAGIPQAQQIGHSIRIEELQIGSR